MISGEGDTVGSAGAASESGVGSRVATTSTSALVGCGGGPSVGVLTTPATIESDVTGADGNGVDTKLNAVGILVGPGVLVNCLVAVGGPSN
jgi:hypothetical protein